jgi:hypothetical protein
MRIFLLTILSLGSLTSCCYRNRNPHYCPGAEIFTLGKVQKNIFPGMYQGDVATILGAPNIVTKDKEGTETWIYDKIASEAYRTGSSGGICVILAGIQSEQAAIQSTQKTLTVVIKFDQEQRVDKVSYHASTF